MVLCRPTNLACEPRQYAYVTSCLDNILGLQISVKWQRERKKYHTTPDLDKSTNDSNNGVSK